MSSLLKMNELPDGSSNLMGIVLCGGQSSRMGSDKGQLVHPGGGTFLQHAVDRLLELCQIVGVSTEPGSDAVIPEGVLRIEDPVSYRGPLIGVAASLQTANELGMDGCLITPVDTPDLTITDLRRLIDAWNPGSSIVCAVDAESDRLQPLIAAYRVDWEPSLKRAAAGEDRSLHRWLNQHDPVLVPLPSRSCRNVNRPGDLSI